MKRQRPSATGREQTRQLSWEFLEARIRRGAAFLELIEGHPRCELVSDANGARLALRVFVPRSEHEDLPQFSAIECIRVGRAPKDLVQLSCTDRLRYQEFYGFVTQVADRVQLRGQPIHEAIRDAADSLRELLATDGVLDLTQQIGLWGEIWFLNRLAERENWKLALDAWVARGTDAPPEQHDFALKAVEIEVKTTQRDVRQHRISSGAQLTPSTGKRLLLLSIQVTRGGSGGESLGDVIQRTLAALPSGLRSRFRKLVQAQGWRDKDAPRYPTRWILRNAPHFVPSEELPRVEVLGAGTERVTGLEFVLDVGGLGVSAEGSWKWLK